MVSVTYWDNQAKVDAALALIITLLAWRLPAWGIGPLFVLSAESISSAARTWVGPALTLLGMMSATTAFIFSVIDRGEFAIIRGSKSEGQLWKIFSENIFWLSTTAVVAIFVSFLHVPTGMWLFYLSSFLPVIVSICVLKFAWVIRQIIAVRAAQAKQNKY